MSPLFPSFGGYVSWELYVNWTLRKLMIMWIAILWISLCWKWALGTNGGDGWSFVFLLPDSLFWWMGFHVVFREFEGFETVDSLSPTLFIFVMETLNKMMDMLVIKGLLNDVILRLEGIVMWQLHISYLPMPFFLWCRGVLTSSLETNAYIVPGYVRA